MAIKDKYTWQDFLKENPDLKEKGFKRTSAEGKKAFEAAQKKYLKDYLKTREAQATRFKKSAEGKRDELVAQLKAVEGRRWKVKAKSLNEKIGRMDAAICNWEKLLKKTKEAAKRL